MTTAVEVESEAHSEAERHRLRPRLAGLGVILHCRRGGLSGEILLRIEAMKYDFLVETYETERVKVVSVWSEFRDEDLEFRPNAKDPRVGACANK